VKGYFLGIKKSIVLRISAIVNIIIALFFIIFTSLYFKIYDIWFFIFSICTGNYFILKSILFLSDASCYLGSLLFSIGIIGLLIKFLNLNNSMVLYFLCVSFTSLIVCIFFKQSFHMFLTITFLLESAFLLLFLQKIINLTIFLALNLILFFIFLSICVIVFRKVKNRR